MAWAYDEADDEFYPIHSTWLMMLYVLYGILHLILVRRDCYNDIETR